MIRIVVQEDYEIVKEFLETLMGESVYKQMFKDYKLSHEIFSLYLKNLNDRIGVLTIDEQGNPTGIGVFDIIPWIGNDAPIRMARLAYIYVKPEERGKGYGKEIMIAFEYWGKRVGATQYSLAHKNKGYTKLETIYMKEVK